MTIATLWFRSASDRGYAEGARPHRRRAGRPARRACRASGSSPRTTGAATTCSSTATSSASTATPTSTRRGSARVYGPGTDAIGSGGQAVVLLVGGNMVLDGTLTIGELTAFVLYLTAFFAPIQQLVQLYTTYQSGQAAVVKLRDLLATDPTVPERADAVDLPPIAGHIVLDHVTFGYDAGHAGAPRRRASTSRRARRSRSWARPAPGKSTIAKLVTRFYDPTAGTVPHRRPRPARRHVRVAAAPARRRAAGAVPLRRLGARQHRLRPARRHRRRGRTRRVAPSASTTCRALPDGLDTLVHERGASLSSGERQLLALARAFLARPRVLVLDEATSNLDLRSEARSSGRSTRCSRAAPRSSSPTGSPPPCAPTASRWSTTAASSSSASHDELSALGGQYATMYDTWQRHMSGHNGHASGDRNGHGNGDGNGDGAH